MLGFSWFMPFESDHPPQTPRNMGHSDRVHELLKFFVILSLFTVLSVILINFLFAFSTKAHASDGFGSVSIIPNGALAGTKGG